MTVEGNRYDFKCPENINKWNRVLMESHEKTLNEVHPTLTLTEEAASYIQDLMLTKCLFPLCSTKTYDIEVVKELVMSKLPHPLNKWAIDEAMQGLEEKRTKQKGQAAREATMLFPYKKLHSLISKEFFHADPKEVPDDVTYVIVCCVEFVCVDAFRLVGSYVKNMKGCDVKVEDVKTALCADKALLELFDIRRDDNTGKLSSDSAYAYNMHGQPSDDDSANLDPRIKAERYTQIVKLMQTEERQNLRNIQMIIYVFVRPLEKYIKPSHQASPSDITREDFDNIFYIIHSLHEISSQLLARLEEVTEFFTSEEKETPLVGDCFLELGETQTLDPYVKFGDWILRSEYKEEYIQFFNKPVIQQHFNKTKDEFGYCTREVYTYVLPRLMYNLIGHAASYSDRLKKLEKLSPDDKDRYFLEQASSCFLPIFPKLSKLAIDLPKREVYFRFVPKPLDASAMVKVNQLLDSVVNIDQDTKAPMYHSPEIIMEGEWTKLSERGKPRVAYLLDGYILCCRRRGNANKVKEWFKMRNIDILDGNQSMGSGGGTPNGYSSGSGTGGGGPSVLNNSFTILNRRSGGVASGERGASIGVGESITYFCETPQEKNNWMVAMLSIHSRSTLERMLDKFLAEEERKQPLRYPNPEQYCFAEPDMREAGDVRRNIITDSKSGLSKVKEATLPKLVERLTYHLHADHAYTEDFFTTYRSFCEASELLALLRARFNIPEIEPTDEEKRQCLQQEPASVRKFRKEYAHPVQSRVLNVLRYWINNHFYDFKNDPKLLPKVQEFLEDARRKSKKWNNYCISIEKAIEKQFSDKQSVLGQTVQFSEEPPKIEWHLASPGDSDTYNLLTLHPLEIARQITLIESKMFRSVQLTELINYGCSSSKMEKRKMFPNVWAWQNFTNRISYFLSFTILDAANLEERVALLSRGWEITQALEDLNNFSGVLMFSAGLNYSSVNRLKITHEKLPAKIVDIKNRLYSKYIQNHAKFYKDALRTTNPPLVPFLGYTFTDVLHIEDSAKTVISGSKLINFHKCRLISAQCRAIMMYQPCPYNLRDDDSIQEWLKSQDVMSAAGHYTESEWQDKLHAMSHEIEPKDAKESFIASITTNPSSGRKYSATALKSPGIKPSPDKPNTDTLKSIKNRLNPKLEHGGGGGGSRHGGSILSIDSNASIQTFSRPSIATSITSLNKSFSRNSHHTPMDSPPSMSSGGPVTPKTADGVGGGGMFKTAPHHFFPNSSSHQSRKSSTTSAMSMGGASLSGGGSGYDSSSPFPSNGSASSRLHSVHTLPKRMSNGGSGRQPSMASSLGSQMATTPRRNHSRTSSPAIIDSPRPAAALINQPQLSPQGGHFTYPGRSSPLTDRQGSPPSAPAGAAAPPPPVPPRVPLVDINCNSQTAAALSPSACDAADPITQPLYNSSGGASPPPVTERGSSRASSRSPPPPPPHRSAPLRPAPQPPSRATGNHLISIGGVKNDPLPPTPPLHHTTDSVAAASASPPPRIPAKTYRSSAAAAAGGAPDSAAVGSL